MSAPEYVILCADAEFAAAYRNAEGAGSRLGEVPAADPLRPLDATLAVMRLDATTARHRTVAIAEHARRWGLA